MKEFYAALLDDVKKNRECREKGQPSRTMVAESRRRILERIGGQDLFSEGNLQKEIDDLLKNVGFLFYRRGYHDAEYHLQALNPIRRTPERHKRFHRAVTRMLEHDIEMEIEEICSELDRQGVTGHFTIRGSEEEIGPRSFRWKNKPTPGAVTEAIERIRANVRSENYARTRQLLLSSTSNDKHRKARAATQGS